MTANFVVSQFTMRSLRLTPVLIEFLHLYDNFLTPVCWTLNLLLLCPDWLTATGVSSRLCLMFFFVVVGHTWCFRQAKCQNFCFHGCVHACLGVYFISTRVLFTSKTPFEAVKKKIHSGSNQIMRYLLVVSFTNCNNQNKVRSSVRSVQCPEEGP